MHPDKVSRNRLHALTDLPNVGPAGAADLQALGITRPDQLRGRCPFDLHAELCHLTGTRHDPCVIDVFMSVIAFMNGAPPLPWWKYTPIRRQGRPTWSAQTFATP